MSKSNQTMQQQVKKESSKAIPFQIKKESSETSAFPNNKIEATVTPNKNNDIDYPMSPLALPPSALPHTQHTKPLCFSSTIHPRKVVNQFPGNGFNFTPDIIYKSAKKVTNDFNADFIRNYLFPLADLYGLNYIVEILIMYRYGIIHNYVIKDVINETLAQELENFLIKKGWISPTKINDMTSLIDGMSKICIESKTNTSHLPKNN